MRHEPPHYHYDCFGGNKAKPHDLADVGTTDRAAQLQHELAFVLIVYWRLQLRQMQECRSQRRHHRRRMSWVIGLGLQKVEGIGTTCLRSAQSLRSLPISEQHFTRTKDTLKHYFRYVQVWEVNPSLPTIYLIASPNRRTPSRISLSLMRE